MSSQFENTNENIFSLPVQVENISSSQELEANQQPTTISDESKIILCVLHQSGYLGAAYYTFPGSDLYILYDTLDLKPDYIITKNLYNQIKPSHTITLGTKSSKFVSILAQISDLDNIEITEYDELRSNLPYNIELLKKNQYSFELCTHAVYNVKLSSEPENLTDDDRKIFLRSLLNFEKRVSIHALGALLIFLNNNFYLLHDTGVQNNLFLNIQQISLKDIVLMNDNIIDALQIFNIKTHPSGEKHNSEGLSIFNLFNYCKSSIGTTNLKTLLLRPTNNLSVLQKRHEFIEFCLKPINQGILNSLQECLQNIFPVGTSLQKIYRNTETIKNWKILHTTLHNILYIKQICEPHINTVELFKDFILEVSNVIEMMRKSVVDVIDFENTHSNKVTVRIGINALLDQKKRFRSDIQEKINGAVLHEIKNLPSHVKECTIVYIPQIGYLVAIKKWAPDAKFEELEEYGYRYKFTVGDAFNYKSAVCDELDKCLGDIHTEIEELESQIIDELGQKIMAHNFAFKNPLKHIAQFDSLICFAQIAKQLSYVRPNLVQENIIEIEDGRHPLLEISKTNFIPNSFYSGGDKSVLKIITGPNNSGKSIYLRQVALIVYLAHIGSYVPAKFARIGMMHSIHTNISENSLVANEITANMSAFATSLRQMSQANNTSQNNSLIIIDEFGRATSELDGLALLTSFLEHYLLRETHCPHILVSTHFLRLTNLIPECRLVKHMKFDFKLVDDKIVFLYKIVMGISKSYAKYTARNFGIPEKVVKRSDQIEKCFYEQLVLKPINAEEL